MVSPSNWLLLYLRNCDPDDTMNMFKEELIITNIYEAHCRLQIAVTFMILVIFR